MPTLRDVAGLAGVSVATVSNVVNNTKHVAAETRERVERAVAQTGYVPNQVARTLARQRAGETAPSRRKGGRPAFRFTAEGPGRKSLLPAAPLRIVNTLRVLRIIRAAQPISRSELACRLGVHRSTVTEVVASLLDAGVLSEGGMGRNSAVRTGRLPVGLSLSDGRDFIVGVCVGVQRTRVGASTLGGRLLREVDFKTPTHPDAATGLIRSAIGQFRATLPGRELRCVGVSVPGIVNAERSRLLYAPHLGWRDVGVADALLAAGESRGSSVIVENDATAAALYEARRRLRNCHGAQWDDFALVRVGTGIGVGLVLGGEVFRGTGNAGWVAGEFGHMTIVAGGKACVCGNRGCWERYASEPGTVSLYTGERAASAGAPVQFSEVVARAKAGERRAQSALGRVGGYLGVGIGNVMTGLGLSRVVVSGRISGGWEFVRGPLNEAIGRSMAGRLAGLSAEPSELAGAELLGALEVAAEQYMTTLTAQSGANGRPSY